MVSLESLEEEDVVKIKSMIEEHFQLTYSPLAKELLVNWSVALSKFIKVMPDDYKAVLQAKKEKIRVAV